MEDNDKDDNNNKDKNKVKAISVLGLDRYMGFSQGHLIMMMTTRWRTSTMMTTKYFFFKNEGFCEDINNYDNGISALG